MPHSKKTPSTSKSGPAKGGVRKATSHRYRRPPSAVRGHTRTRCGKDKIKMSSRDAMLVKMKQMTKKQAMARARARARAKYGTT